MVTILLENDMPHVGDYNLSATDVADILWLAAFMAPPVMAVATEDLPAAEAADFGSGGNGADVLEDSQLGWTEEIHAERPEKPETLESTDGETAVHHPPEPVASLFSGGEAEGDDGSDAWSGVGFKAPQSPAILGKAAIVRSLRPLQRRVPSPREFFLDEAETSERIAAAVVGRGSWLPARYPVQERWLDLVVLVDGASSMALWQQTVEEFIALLRNTGIFRNVQRWTLAVLEMEGAVNDERKTELHLYPAQAARGSTYRRRSATELLDQQQRRLFMVLSDCSSIVWDSGAAQRLLQPLAAHNLVSLVQMLPEELWQTTALRLAEETRLTTQQALSTNAQLDNLQLVAKLEQRGKAYPIPVVSLEPEALRIWAGFLAGRERRSVVGYYLPTADDLTIDVDHALLALGITPQPLVQDSEVVVADLYDTFRESVPQRARPLAAYFAAAPLTLPVMRMVQAVLLPRTNHADFVRVFYSGLIWRTTAQTADRADSAIIYDFVGGDAMRQFLLTRIPRSSAEQVIDLVIAELSRYVQEHLDQLASFDAIIAVRGAQGVLHVDATAQHFAEVTAKVLRYLGGVYAALADNLEQLVQLPGNQFGEGNVQTLGNTYQVQTEYEIEQVVQSVKFTLGSDLVDTLQPILYRNEQRMRIQQYQKTHPTGTVQEYVFQVARNYQKDHDYLDLIQNQKSSEAWEPLIDKIQGWAYSFLSKWHLDELTRRNFTLEIVQETVLAIIRTHFPYDSEFDTWAHVITRHVCSKYMQQNGPSLLVKNIDLSEVDEWFQALGESAIADLEFDVKQALLEAIQQLSENQKIVIWYLYFEGWSIPQIATHLQVAINAIYKRYSDALEELRKILTASENFRSY